MKVIKKDGRIQDFDIQKIRVSIENASDEANAPMSSSDIGNIIEDIQQIIDSSGLKRIHVSDIQTMVVNTLKKLGFSVVARYYYEHAAEKNGGQ